LHPVEDIFALQYSLTPPKDLAFWLSICTIGWFENQLLRINTENTKGTYMGRGDKRTEKGKRTRGSYGKSRSKATLKARARTAAAGPKKVDKPAETATA
jgi:ribosomal small subunit protein bTHX